MIKKLLFLLTLVPSLVLAQQTIKGSFSPAEEFNYAILYKVTPETSVYVKNSEISKDGSFSFQMDSTNTKGIYRIVYAVPQDEYNFDIIYNAKEDVELAFNLDKGVTYLESNENKLLSSYNKSLDLVSNSINNYYAQSNQDKKSFNSVFKVLKNTQEEFEKVSEGTLAYHFIKASRPYSPEQFEDAKTYSNNLKDAYFKHINFNDNVLQSSDFLIEATLNYMFNFIDSTNENKSFKDNVDDVVQAIGENPVVKRILLEILWNQFEELNNETVANYISDTYLLDIAQQNNDAELVDKITVYSNTSLGKIAPDFNVEIPTEDGKVDIKILSDLEIAENYVIVFWSSSCSHCLDELPLLNDYVKTFDDQAIKVIAIGLEEEPYRWKDKTYDFTEFFHIYGEGKWDNEIGNAYGVSATPTYFILDKNKKIISKPNDFLDVKEYYTKKPIKVVKPDVIEIDEKAPLLKEDLEPKN